MHTKLRGSLLPGRASLGGQHVEGCRPFRCGVGVGPAPPQTLACITQATSCVILSHNVDGILLSHCQAPLLSSTQTAGRQEVTALDHTQTNWSSLSSAGGLRKGRPTLAFVAPESTISAQPAASIGLNNTLSLEAIHPWY